MLKNRDFRNLILFSAGLSLVFSLCGFVFAGMEAGVLILVLGAVLTALFSYFTRKRYLALEALNDSLSRVLAGETLPDILDQEEGEVSLLKANIFKSAAMLTNQKELLQKEKTGLADAIADISHQLRTPLASMMVMNDLLKNEEDAGKRAEFLNVQSAQLDRMKWLINTLLKLSRIDAGMIGMKKEEVILSELVMEAVKSFEIQMELMNIQREIHVQDICVTCDRNWTGEALQNIIKNCCEHMPEGGVLKIETEDTNIYAEIRVFDTGGGISEEDRPHIFERFYRGKNAGKDSVGIGLALAKAIMVSQHGDIIAGGKEGEGAVFSLRFNRTVL